MGFSDAESDEVEEEEEASNVSFSDDIGDLGDSEGEEEDSKEEDPLPPIKVRDIFGKNLSNKDVTAEVPRSKFAENTILFKKLWLKGSV